jgi:hypothetical protein
MKVLKPLLDIIIMSNQLYGFQGNHWLDPS